MSEPRIWQSTQSLPDYPSNLAIMLNLNINRFPTQPLYQEVRNGEYVQLTWQAFRHDVTRIQDSLVSRGLGKGDRVAILSPNRMEMLETELAIMSLGAVAVPLFAGYPADQANALVEFSEPKFVVVADTNQFLKVKSSDAYECIIHFDALSCPTRGNTVQLSQMVDSSSVDGPITGVDTESDDVCLMMYTSGTMGKPKLVQLTHRNILSQQAAMRVLWKLEHTDRFLSYLPWHHSFGGIYEKYAALYNGAMLSLDPGYGKDCDKLLENWKRVRPTVFFSVPRIYQQIVTRVLQDPQWEQEIFHSELRFIFTAAAPLPKSISDVFERRGIPIYEGYGLTETSPCCTISDPSVPREPGVVGKPIPGVTLKLAEDGEILVKGPNIMRGYFHNLEATDSVLFEDGWFATGDVGEFADTGLRLVSRKDRIFKLSNAEKVVPTEIENLIVEDCCFLSHAFVTGNGKDHPVVLLFPNKTLFDRKPEESRLKEGCSCPSGVKDLAFCLSHCLKKLTDRIDAKYMRPHAAMLIDHELSIEGQELTPSMKLAPNVVGKVFKAQIEHLYGESSKNGTHNVFVIDLEKM